MSSGAEGLDPAPTAPALAVADESAGEQAAQPPDPTAEVAPAADDLIEAVLVPPKGLVAVILTALLLTAALAVWITPGHDIARPPNLRLDLWRSNPADLQAIDQHNQALLRLPRDPQIERDLRDRWQKRMAAEAEQGVDALALQPQARIDLGEMEELTRQLVSRQGSDALRTIAVAYGRDVRAALTVCIKQAAREHQPLASFLQAEPPSDAARKLREMTGGLGRALAHAGLEFLAPRGRLDPAAALVVEALAQQRLLTLGQRVPGGAPQLPSDVELLLLRFRIEAHEGLSPERKLDLLRTLAVEDPSAPVEFLRGVLMARNGQCRQAVPWLLKAAQLGQNSQVARADAQWCAAQLSAHPRQ